MTTPEIAGDIPRIEWVRITEAINLLWADNPKLHDIGSIFDSLRKYGIQELPKYDNNLTNVRGGKGAIKAGNGRIEALYQMYLQKEPVPRGVAYDKNSGEWVIPVIFGVDAESEEIASAYAIDSNNLVLSGGDYNFTEIAKLWNPKDYYNIISKLAKSGERVVSIPDYDDVINYLDNYLFYNSCREKDAETVKKIIDEDLARGLPRYLKVSSKSRYKLFNRHYFLITNPFSVKEYYPYLTRDCILIVMPTVSIISSSYLLKAKNPVIMVHSSEVVSDYLINLFIHSHGIENIVVLDEKN